MSHQLLSSPSPAQSETLGRILCPVGSFVCTPEGTAEPLHTSKGYRGSAAVVEGPSCEQDRALGLFQYREGQHICHPPCKCACICVGVCTVTTSCLTDACAHSGLKGQRSYLPLAQSIQFVISINIKRTIHCTVYITTCIIF